MNQNQPTSVIIPENTPIPSDPAHPTFAAPAPGRLEAKKILASAIKKTQQLQANVEFITKRLPDGKREAMIYAFGNRHTRRYYEAQVNRIKRQDAHKEFRKKLRERYKAKPVVEAVAV